MGLVGHMRIHYTGIHRNVDNTDTPRTPSNPVILTTIATHTTTNHNPQPLPISPAHTASAISPHASAWSVRCESITQRLAKQGLGLRNTVVAPASTALTAPPAFTHHMSQLDHMRLHDNLR
ncbi:unnamed protein product [Schistocephalus solidus]|uniref:Uncharacterized protein n=1 Tax=Schistocephalus solidus TaxID=70667 RepID=A0A183T4N1_SCHSO|nr:unnamed protein product [Schistocephalus solidus]